MKNDKAFIFDFNGTLFWDNEENKQAWSDTAKHYRGKPFSEEEFHFINGKSDRAASVFILGSQASEDKLNEVEIYKETLYKKLCLQNKKELASGAYEFFKALKTKEIPIAIASSAPKMNMDWYIPHFGLDKYFEMKNIVAGREDIKGKPEPDIFLIAASILGVNIENCVIIEDSKAGLTAAKKSGAKTVVGVKSFGADLSETTPLSDFMIDDFKDERLWMLM